MKHEGNNFRRAMFWAKTVGDGCKIGGKSQGSKLMLPNIYVCAAGFLIINVKSSWWAKSFKLEVSAETLEPKWLEPN